MVYYVKMLMDCNTIQTIENINNVLKYFEFIIAIILIIGFSVDCINIINNKVIVGENNSKRIYYKLLIAILVIAVPNGLFSVIKHYTYNANDCAETSSVSNEKEKNNDQFYINAVKDRISKLNNELNNEYYDDAIENLNNIKNDEIKNQLKEELNTLKKYLDYKINLDKLKNSYNSQEYYNLYLEIENSENNTLKKYLLEYISTLGFNKILNIKSGIYQNRYGNMSYYEGIPNHPTENMALVIFMQPYDCQIDLFKNSLSYINQEFFFLAPPDLGPYNDDLLKNFKVVIDSTVSKYGINRNKIIITGHSNGALSTLKMVSFFPDYFAVAVPISSTLPNFGARAYSNTAFWGICGSGESCATTMQEYAESINRIGGNAKYSVVNGGHGDTACSFVDKQVLTWVFAQEKK